MNPLDAAFNLVNEYPGGAAALGVRMDKSASSLAHELRGAGTAKLGLMDAAKITALTGDTRIIAALAAGAGGVFVPLAHDASGDPMQQMAEMMSKMAALQVTTAQAFADGAVSLNELRKIESTAQGLIGAVNALTAHSRGMHEATKPPLGDAEVIAAFAARVRAA